MRNLAIVIAAATLAPTALAASGLPLKHGFYVRTEAPSCGAASSATLLMLNADGLAGVQDFCRFDAIEAKSETEYLVTQFCYPASDPASGDQSTATYTLTAPGAFTVKSSYGWEYSARHCEQSTLPEPWNSVDLSE